MRENNVNAGGIPAQAGDTQAEAARRWMEAGRNPTKPKKSIGKSISLGILGGIMVFEGAGMAYTQIASNEPVSAHTLIVDALHPWNIGIKAIPSTFDNNASMHSITDESISGGTAYEREPVFVKAGVNAVSATEKDIQQLLNQQPTVMIKPEPKGYASIVEMVLPFNPENAQEIKIVKSYALTGPNDNDAYYVGAEEVYIIGKDVPFFIPLINGAQSVNIKSFDLKYGVNSIEFDYNLKDGQKKKLTMVVVNSNFVLSDALKACPRYERDSYETTDEKWALPTKEFDLTTKNAVDLFHVTGNARIALGLLTGDFSKGFVGEDINFVTNSDGKILYQSAGPQ